MHYSRHRSLTVSATTWLRARTRQLMYWPVCQKLNHVS